MKKIIALCTVLFTGSAFAFVGIPVADNPAAAVRVVEWAQLLKQWGETVKQYDKEITAYKDQLATATGVRNIGGFLGEFRNLKGQLEGYSNRSLTLDEMLSSSGGGLSSDAERIFNKYKMFDVCKGQNMVSTANCKEKIVNKASTLDAADTISKQLQTKMKDASVLADRAEKSKDSKESQDLANAIGVKNMEISALQTQWNIYTQQNQAREKLLDEKRKAAFKQQQTNAPVPTFN